MSVEELARVAAVNFLNIKLLDDGVVFWGERGVVHYSETTGNRIWNYIDDPLTVFEEDGLLYISSSAQGIFRMDGDELVELEGSKAWSGSAAFVDSVRMGNDTIIASRNRGLFRFGSGGFEPILSAADIVLRNGILRMEALGDTYLAIVVAGKGLLILDAAFEVVLFVDAEQDTNFASIHDLHYSEEGILWATTPYGLMKMMFPSPLSVLDHRNGLRVLWPRTYYDGSRWLIYSGKQLFAVDDTGPTGISRFRVFEIEGMRHFDDVAFTDRGIFLSEGGKLSFYDLENGDLSHVIEGVVISKTIVSRTHPGYAVASSLNRHHLLQWREGRWVDTGEQQQAIGFVAVALESSHGDLWFEQGIGKASRVTIDPVAGTFGVQYFDGVPEIGMRWVNIFEIEGTVYLKTHDQIAAYDPAAKVVRQVPMPAFLNLPLAGNVSRPMQDRDGGIWMPSESGVFYLQKGYDGTLFPDYERLELMRDNNPVIHMLEDGNAFIQSKDRLLFYQRRLEAPPRKTRHPVLTLVRADGTPSPVYSIYRDGPGSTPASIPYAMNTLTFVFHDSSFYHRRTPRFITKLDGLGNDWTDPSLTNRATYTQLREGRYLFRVRSLNAFGVESAESTFSFVIRPPWYRTWWSYTAVSLLALLALCGLDVAIVVRFPARKTPLGYTG
jgi:hypothetical protein